MFWTKEECQQWLPFVQAVAEGKEIEEWTGYMEEVQEGKTYSTDHCFVNDNGKEYASLIDTEYASVGNILPIVRSNRTQIQNPSFYLRIKE